jgi:hypothetical protein
MLSLIIFPVSSIATFDNPLTFSDTAPKLEITYRLKVKRIVLRAEK